jgi:HPt (histidine-containing phosphotransfer) domain-containing protein
VKAAQPPECAASLRQLRDAFGNEAAAELIAAFLQDTPGRLEELHRLQSPTERELFTRTAHSLAGSAGIFGLTPMREQALALEQLARQEGEADFAPGLAVLRTQYEAIRPVLETELNVLQHAAPPVPPPSA